MCVYLCTFTRVTLLKQNFYRQFLPCGTFADTFRSDTRTNWAEHYKQTFKWSGTIYSKKGDNKFIVEN